MVSLTGPDSQGVRAHAGRFQAVVRVLIFVRRLDNLLLLRGGPDKPIWPGLLNGIGGHVEPGEDPLSAAQRELREECGLDLDQSALSLAAVITVDLGISRSGVLLFVFVATTDQQAVVASVEGTPEWHPLNALDGLPLVPDLPWLIPQIWSEERDSRILFARYSYDASGRLEIHPAAARERRGIDESSK